VLSAQILAAVAVSIFPLHAEIDCGPLALRVGTAYKFRIAVESVAGKKAENMAGATAAATLDDAADVVFQCLRDTVGMRRQGVIITATEIDGSPLRSVKFEFADGGPKPIVRWVPKGKK
jgi:hypothetical protein